MSIIGLFMKKNNLNNLKNVELIEDFDAINFEQNI